jgi:hypothetical protein
VASDEIDGSKTVGTFVAAQLVMADSDRGGSGGGALVDMFVAAVREDAPRFVLHTHLGEFTVAFGDPSCVASRVGWARGLSETFEDDRLADLLGSLDVSREHASQVSVVQRVAKVV